MNENSLLEKRMIFGLVISLMTGLLAWNRLLSGEAFVQLQVWIYGTFVAGKVASDWIPFFKARAAAVSPAEKDPRQP